MENFDFDVIVVGSGFGGSVMTCRLAEKGYRVCLLERGREYGMGDFPRRIQEMKNAVWDPEDHKYGLFEIMAHPDSDVCTVNASGLGGGSLIYSSVLQRMEAESFYGWPGNIDAEELHPYYEKVLAAMQAEPYPFDDPFYRATPKTQALKDAATRLSMETDGTAPPTGYFPPLGIWFKGDQPGEQSKNMHDVLLAKCTKCGDCTIGCNIHAKNSLNLNYLARARNQALLGAHGVAAEIRTRTIVTDIRPTADKSGYTVTCQQGNEQNQTTATTLTAKKVVLACGAVNTPALLTRLKKKGSLPELGMPLGKHWCGNGDLEANIHSSAYEMAPTIGPTITYAIRYKYKDYPDGFPHSAYIEDGGLPQLLSWYIVGILPSAGALTRALQFILRAIKRLLGGRPLINVGDEVSRLIKNDHYLRHSMVLLCMGRDRSDGEVTVNEQGDVIIKWRMDSSKLHLDRLSKAAENLSRAAAGKLQLNPLTYLDKLIAVHCLGGCVMADSPEQGVVDINGEVFGYPGLYIADGSIIPSSTGPNPSLTIAAMAERIADRFPLKK
ncbi:MAG: GMC family oxidoreductase [Gammaproteobacteria bacterium]|nr:GMC family oxidoreductase [Gammaproteobacteria bacterium]MDH5651047.1 GMC family oxidoreductase [Gammaproteobacteria bacterium]